MHRGDRVIGTQEMRAHRETCRTYPSPLVVIPRLWPSSASESVCGTRSRRRRSWCMGRRGWRHRIGPRETHKIRKRTATVSG